MKPIVLAAMIVILRCAIPLGAQAVFGGQAQFALNAMINPEDIAASAVDDVIGFSPSVNVESAPWRLDARLTMQWDRAEGSAGASIQQLSLELAPAGFLTLRIGRFPYLPGVGGMLSFTDFFATTNLDALVQGAMNDLSQCGDMIQAIMTLGDVSLNLTVSPFAPAGSIPDTGSAWFPMKDFPQTLHLVFPLTQDISLAGISVETVASSAAAMTDMSVGGELSVSLPAIDISLLAYHGRDNTPLYQPSFNFPNGFFSDYQIVLTPVVRTIDALGIDASLVVSGFGAWADCAYVFSKTFLSKKLSVSTFSADLVTSPTFQYAFGASYDVAVPSISLEAGYRSAIAVEPTSDMIAPFMRSFLSGSCHVRLADGTVAIGTQALLSAADWSSVVVVFLSLTPSAELSFTLDMPIFMGEPDTELGQFSGNHLVTVGVTARY